jgi:hypothetical protein
VLLLNNQHLGMVVQWEDRFYKANRAHTYLGKREAEWHETQNEADIYPNFKAMAEVGEGWGWGGGWGVAAWRDEADIYPNFKAVAEVGGRSLREGAPSLHADRGCGLGEARPAGGRTART